MLSERLAKLRKDKKKTQQEMADYLGITRPAYTAYERSSRQPDYEILQKLADFFDVSLDYLLGRTDNPNPPDKIESKPLYTSPLTEKDYRDIAKRLEEIKKDVEHADGLAFDGEPMSEEAQESFLEAMEYVVRTTKKINKKYTPKKYRKENKDE